MITAFDPSGLLSIIGMKHTRSNKPVEKFNFLAKHDLRLARNMPSWILWDGEVLDEDSEYWQSVMGDLEPSALIIGHQPVNTSHRHRVFYPHHLLMTIDSNPKLQDIFVPEQKPFLADALLGQPRPHRWMILNRLREQDLLERCLVNFKNGRFETMDNIDHMRHNFPNWGQPRSYESKNLQLYDKQLASKKSNPDFFDSILPFSDQNQRWTSQIIPWDIYSASWVSIVAETDHTVGFFPTEKIAKCLLAGRIFFLSGTQHYLKNLKSLGFETFDDIIDESYDNLVDYVERTDAMMRSFNAFCKQDMKLVHDKVLSKLKHNRSLMHKEYLTRPARLFLQGMAV